MISVTFNFGVKRDLKVRSEFRNSNFELKSAIIE
jgi:hypothetical protein